MNDTNQISAVLAAVGKPKRKITVITFGGGAFNCLTRGDWVTKGPVTAVGGAVRLALSLPKKRKVHGIDAMLEQGAIVLDGHFPEVWLVESDGPNYLMGSPEYRFRIDVGGKQKLLDFLKAHCILHTLHRVTGAIQAVEFADRHAKGEKVEDIGDELRELLGAGVEEVGARPLEPVIRKSIFTENQITKLKDAHSPEAPKIQHKLFDPTGAGTWLITGMEPDGDTMWGYCDVGMGMVEFGTVSLTELETARLPSGLHIERDRHFTRCDFTGSELLAMDSIPTGLQRDAVPLG